MTEDAERERADARRERAEANLKARLKSAYLGSNPAASASDFERAYPGLRRRHMADEARDAPARAKAAQRRLLGHAYSM